MTPTTPSEADRALAVQVLTDWNGMIEAGTQVDFLAKHLALARRSAIPPPGSVLCDDGVVREARRVWWCEYCGTCYAEYVNGCPRCHLGEPGTATSVQVRLLVNPAAQSQEDAK